MTMTDPNFAPTGLVTANGRGRLVDARKHEAPTPGPRRIQFEPDFDIERPPARKRRTPPAWLGWLIATVSLAINVGLFAALAVIGGHIKF